MFSELMVDFDYSQVEIALQKIYFHILEYFWNIQVLPVDNLVRSKNVSFI